MLETGREGERRCYLRRSAGCPFGRSEQGEHSQAEATLLSRARLLSESDGGAILYENAHLAFAVAGFLAKKPNEAFLIRVFVGLRKIKLTRLVPFCEIRAVY